MGLHEAPRPSVRHEGAEMCQPRPGRPAARHSAAPSRYAHAAVDREARAGDEPGGGDTRNATRLAMGPSSRTSGRPGRDRGAGPAGRLGPGVLELGRRASAGWARSCRGPGQAGQPALGDRRGRRASHQVRQELCSTAGTVIGSWSLEPRECEQQRSLPRPLRELVPTSVPTFPWRRETPGYASKRSTYWNL